MKKVNFHGRAICCAAILLLRIGTSSGQITVACAANMQFAMERILASYDATGGAVRVIYGASGKFVTQIRNGAPFDVFVSADTDYPESLFVHKFTVDKPKVYAYGKLVLWTTKNLDVGRGITVLTDPTVKTIAVPDPKSAPYGREALKALRNAAVYDAVLPRLVYGENISQTAQYIVTGSADIGFNAKAIVLSARMKTKGKWAEVDSTLYDPIAQGVVVCRYGADNNPGASQRFVKYLFGAQARDILQTYGYILP